MEEIDFIFHGDRSGTGPMTWGQREQWISICKIAPEDARFNIPFLWNVADGVTVQKITDGLKRLVERHEALRTRITGTVESPLQVVHRTGEYEISLRELPETPHEQGEIYDQCNPSLSWGHVRELSGRRFDLTHEWPARFRILLGPEKRPRWVCGAISHVAADATAVGILERDFNVLLGTGRKLFLSNSPYQPLDRAKYENSTSGKEFLTQALAHWKDSLRRFPPLSRGESRSHVDGDRFPRVSLYSKSLGEIAQQTAEQWGVWESAIFMAAFGQALLEMTKGDGFPMIVTSANRSGRLGDEYVGTIAQQGVALVSATTDFPGAVRELWRFLIRMPRHSSYDPVAVGELIADSSDGLFESFDHFVNYRKAASEVDSRELAGGFTGNRVFLPDDRVASTLLRFGLMIRSYGQDAQSRLFYDSCYINRDSIKSMLLRMDDLIREAGSADANRWNHADR
ncbi:condensation domain-containing protein [Streptomyces sp. VNUA24]|uniref:condensation domain-containing protein n=1 Tax=Streptomyces sp. VNUA24 TaxID=3031131 RepID=UPI0023B78B2E|nr:condensation domain-containing protein [Streptomyces sp. VNUA24]WEH12236.1 condensation domain-containing protein [Streptomyces sp. VNUA24]